MVWASTDEKGANEKAETRSFGRREGQDQFRSGFAQGKETWQASAVLGRAIVVTLFET